MPSSLQSRRAISPASSFFTTIVSSMTLVSSVFGTNPGPQPWILCGPGLPPEMTGESAGSAATIFSPGRRGFSTWPTPVRVPPVPVPQTTMSTLPSVSFQISSAVVLRWISGFAGFSNCWRTRKRASCAAISSARLIAPFIPSAPGVRTSSAPSARRSLRRSIDIVSGMVRTIL